MIIYIPFFQIIFETVPLGLYDWMRIMLLASLGLLVPPGLFHSRTHLKEENAQKQ
jgi:hypothetical protein